MGRYRRILIPIAGILIAFFLMTQWLSSMIYPAPSIPVSSPPPALREIQIPVASNRITGWAFDAAETSPDSLMLLYFHGNGENLETMRLSGLFQDLLELNVSFLAIDYPSYGKSTGKASEQNVLNSGNAALMYLRQTHADHRVILCGWSLGASVAILTAASKAEEVTGLIALSAWTSLPEVAKVHFPGWFVGALLREQYDSLQAAKGIRCPTLLIHGGNDSLIPATHGKRIAEVLGSRCRWVLLPEAAHNDMLGRQPVWNEISQFLATFRR